MARILIVDDEKDIREVLGDILDDEGHEATKVGHAQAAIDNVDQHEYDLAILDIWLKESHMDGLDILKYIKSSRPDLPVVIISGHGNVEIAVAAVKQGAFDFIEKPFNLDQLLVVVNRALELSDLRRSKRMSIESAQPASQMIGNSGAMMALRAQIEKLAKTQSRVMFIGPSGSGKEVAARNLHAQSARSDMPFVTVSSAMLNADDMERQLFGFEEGGKVKMGLFERATGGTLFFDEVADMPLDTQGKILRVINEQKFERIGSSLAISVDIRLLSATKENLAQRIKDGQFREELFHRLSVVPVTVPPLSQRPEDVEELVSHFVAEMVLRDNLSAKTFSTEAINTLQLQSWPGNVRELRNRIERLLILSTGDNEISTEDISKVEGGQPEGAVGAEYLFLPLREARELFETRYLNMQIGRFSGNISRTASFIGMERSALHRKMKSLDIGGQNGKNDE